MTVSTHINDKDEVTEAFATLMVRLAAAFPSSRPLTDEGIRVYARGLYDLTIEQVRGCFGRAVRELKFMPSVAEARQFLVPSGDDAAVLSWAGFDRAARTVGAYSSLEVEDACAAAALLGTTGSWSAFCDLAESPELALARQTYLAAYRQARRTPTGRQGRPVRLPGLCEASGRYAAEALAGRVWVATLTAGWTIEPHRDRPRTALPEAANVRRLTTGVTEGS